MIYPNPASDVLNLVLAPEDNKTYISIIDRQGRIVQKETLEPKTESSKIDLSKLNEGIYILNVNSSGLFSSFLFSDKADKKVTDNRNNFPYFSQAEIPKPSFLRNYIRKYSHTRNTSLSSCITYLLQKRMRLVEFTTGLKAR